MHSCLLKLQTCFNFTLSSYNVSFTAEVSNYQTDKSLKVFKSGDCLDTWRNYIFKSDRYSCLPKVVKAALSIFIGSQIEISFSMMNNNIDKCSSCMDMGAIMNIKYDLIAKGHLFKNVIVRIYMTQSMQY